MPKKVPDTVRKVPDTLRRLFSDYAPAQRAYRQHCKAIKETNDQNDDHHFSVFSAVEDMVDVAQEFLDLYGKLWDTVVEPSDLAQDFVIRT